MTKSISSITRLFLFVFCLFSAEAFSTEYLNVSNLKKLETSRSGVKVFTYNSTKKTKVGDVNIHIGIHSDNLGCIANATRSIQNAYADLEVVGGKRNNSVTLCNSATGKCTQQYNLWIGRNASCRVLHRPIPAK
ncbi:hypothetical protein GW916_06695 [bacterium]|nr:hypothetical protein [bacterium]